ncbi:MAG TPA: PadR family transcriptional regulator, partial [Mycobacterium sp.]|nr:PadR family transcriptional regulator [Mycobacterium sp.]
IAVSRVDQDHLDDLSAIITARTASLSAMLEQWEAHAAAIDRYLSVSERMVMKHRADRLRAEIAWHEQLSAALPEIIDDQRERRTQ